MHIRHYVLTLALLILPALASAHPPRVDLPSLPGLKASAIESVDVSLGPMMLHVMGWMLDDHDAQSASLKRTLRGLKSVHIRSYRFKDDFVYPQTELDELRRQLSQPAWSHLLKARNRDDREDVDIYVALEDETIRGVTVIATNSHELTVINVVGSVSPDQIQDIRNAFAKPDGRLARASQSVP